MELPQSGSRQRALFDERQEAQDSQSVHIHELPAMVTTPATQAGSSEGRKLTPANLLLIVEWLEEGDNFAMLNGGDRVRDKGAATKHPNKKTVFRLMLVWIQSRGFASFVANGDNLGKRFGRYVAKYKEALGMKRDSGFGVTMEEIRAGITIEAKLDKICPHFERMHALYGHRANVSPPSTGCVGLPGHSEIFVDQGSDDDDGGEAEEIPHIAAPTPSDVTTNMPCRTESCLDGQPVDDFSERPEEPESTEDVSPQHGYLRPEGPEPTPLGTGSPDASQATPRSLPQSTRGTPHGPRRGTPRRAVPSQATSRPNLAEVYLEKLNEKNVFKQQIIEAKDKWRLEDMRERKEFREAAAREAREAREAVARDANELRENTARESRDRDRSTRLHEAKKAKVEHDHQLRCINSQQTLALLTELIKTNRTCDEMQTLLGIIPKVLCATAAMNPMSDSTTHPESGLHQQDGDSIDLD